MMMMMMMMKIRVKFITRTFCYMLRYIPNHIRYYENKNSFAWRQKVCMYSAFVMWLGNPLLAPLKRNVFFPKFDFTLGNKNKYQTTWQHSKPTISISYLTLAHVVNYTNYSRRSAILEPFTRLEIVAFVHYTAFAICL